MVSVWVLVLCFFIAIFIGAIAGIVAAFYLIQRIIVKVVEFLNGD